jgi:hypothetical protein
LFGLLNRSLSALLARLTEGLSWNSSRLVLSRARTALTAWLARRLLTRLFLTSGLVGLDLSLGAWSASLRVSVSLFVLSAHRRQTPQRGRHGGGNQGQCSCHCHSSLSVRQFHSAAT